MPDITPPTVSSITINGATLTITYNETLGSNTPTPSAYTVIVNSTPRAVSFVSVSTTTAILTLSSPVVVSDVVTLTYSP